MAGGPPNSVSVTTCSLVQSNRPAGRHTCAFLPVCVWSLFISRSTSGIHVRSTSRRRSLRQATSGLQKGWDSFSDSTARMARHVSITVQCKRQLHYAAAAASAVVTRAQSLQHSVESHHASCSNIEKQIGSSYWKYELEIRWDDSKLVAHSVSASNGKGSSSYYSWCGNALLSTRCLQISDSWPEFVALQIPDPQILFA